VQAAASDWRLHGKLARQGATIVMVCRDAERGEAARKDVAAVATGLPPAVFLADLLSQQEIRYRAGAIKNAYARIDVLVNNAGAVFARRELSVDGIEKTFAVNHLAPFLLTNLLLDRVRAAGHTRHGYRAQAVERERIPVPRKRDGNWAGGNRRIELLSYFAAAWVGAASAGKLASSACSVLMVE
jgi:NAD(P)-dependent dehydrogenase (short-subunit alcohol dehydrogenase family)